MVMAGVGGTAEVVTRAGGATIVTFLLIIGWVPG
jgi:hypothetical protein